jgi:dCTP deaminase
MAFLGYDELKKVLEVNIKPFNDELFQGASYELTLGDEVYLTNSKSGKIETLNESNSQIEIEPGQFALLLINEEIYIPENYLAFITLKFSEKIKGLINISGFHVDPGFRGKLIYSVYNAGPRSIFMKRGLPYFSIWYSELKGKVDNQKIYKGKHQYQKNIDIKYIELLKGELASPNSLLDKINQIEKSLNTKITELKGKKENILWGISIILGLLLAVNLKVWWEWSSYKNGYYDGLDEKRAKEKIENTIRKMNIDSILKHENSLYHAKSDTISIKKATKNIMPNKN